MVVNTRLYQDINYRAGTGQGKGKHYREMFLGQTSLTLYDKGTIFYLG